MPYLVPDQVKEPLFALVPYFNCWRWKSREKHTTRAVKHFIDSGAVVILVEIGFNRRELAFANSGINGLLAECKVLGSGHEFRHKYIGLHSKDELWLKECAINVGVQHLTQEHYDWQNVCWLDSDILFVRPNWVGECIHKLQHGTTSDRAFVQMFSQAQDVGPNYELLPQDYPHAHGVSFIQAWKNGTILNDVDKLNGQAQKVKKELTGANPKVKQDIGMVTSDIAQLAVDLQQYPYPPKVFPGLAWACTRKAWDAVGGLPDFAIWGGSDWHQAHCLIEKREGMMRNDLHRNYKKLVNQWFERCRTHIRQNVLVMEGMVLHNWHGKKVGRGYNSKHALLARFGFDPLRHLTRDSQGLYQLHDDRSDAYVKIRDMMRRIAKERNEDDPNTGLETFEQGH